MRRQGVDLPDADLAYLTERTHDFDDYVEAVAWAQDFASKNRAVMMAAVLAQLARVVGAPLAGTEQVVACHHNYVSREHHFGADVIVTRSYIVRGKGNTDSFASCSHGAGRAMSRTEARRRFTLADHARAVQGVECRRDAAVIDETPAAYKDIDAVMAAQTDLVDIEHTLRQVLCVKG